MTRKDYEAIAEVFKRTAGFIDDGGCATKTAVWEELQIGIRNVFIDDNPRFDAAKFREACEPNTP